MNVKNTITRICALAIAMLVSIGAQADTWTDPDTGYTWTYRISGNIAEIYNSGSCAVKPRPTGALTIPSMLNGKTVTSIGAGALSMCSELTSVIIGNSITSIGDSAFSYCSGLASVTIGNSITSIGDSAFYDCSGLTSVTIPGSVTNIGDKAFHNCSGLTSVTIPGSVTSIGERAFRGCSGLASVTIPDSVTSIGYCAFYECSGLASVTIGNSVTNIGEGAFYNCSGLTNVTIGNGMTSIGNFAFSHCSRLASVMIPDSVTSIGEGAFYDCSSLEYASVPVGCSIDKSAFPKTTQIIYRTPVQPRTVTFDAAGGEVSPSSMSVTYGGTYGSLPTPTLTGYDFVGWKYNENVITSNSIVAIDADHTLVAQWTAKQLAVTLDANGGNCSPSSKTVTYGVAYGMLPTPIRDGYLFGGWMLNGNPVTASTVVSVSEPHTLVAQWSVDMHDPVISPADGSTFSSSSCTVTLTCATPGATIYFSTNGVAPRTSAAYAYTGPFAITDTTTIMATAALDGTRSNPVTATITKVDPVPPEAPVITPADGSSFIGDSCEVSISCATPGATIYYSTNGVAPRTSAANAYTGPFTITGTTTIMAIAAKDGLRSEPVTATITKRILSLAEAAGAPQLSFATDGAANWTPIADETTANGLSVRSGAIPAADSGTIETRFAVTVNGAGTFTFNWKVDCEHDDFGTCSWDRLMVYTNGAEAAKMDGTTEWRPMSFSFAGNGANTVCWIFLRDDYDDPGAEYANCGWVSGVTWTPSAIIVPASVTGTNDIEVPQDWPECFAGFTTAFGTDKESAMRKPTGKMDTSGNPMYVWQDYVAGTDPTDMDSRFTAEISISNDVPYITWSPNLNTNGVVRKYTILGKESLTDTADWAPTNSTHRFFKVKVEMP